METKRTESRHGRFAALLKGSARPRRSLALMMALVIVAVMSMAGVVSADDYYKGLPPETIAGMPGVVNGDFWVNTSTTTWDNSGAIDRDVWANFTVPATGGNVKFARLYVTVYSGNMLSNYKGYESVTLRSNNAYTLAQNQPLDLEYFNTSGINTTSVFYPDDYFVSLSRDTSDYVSAFDVTNLITTSDVNVNIVTTNTSPKFDGRIKQATLVVAYNVSSSAYVTRYWVNEGQDPITYKANNQVPGETWFNGASNNSFVAAKIYANYLASNDGVYTWNGRSLTGLTNIQGNQTGLSSKSLSDTVIGSNNYLSYNRTANFYKLPLAFLKIQSGS